MRNKIITLSTVLVLLGTAVTQFLFYRYTADQVTRTAYENSIATSAQACEYFNARIKGIIKSVYGLVNNDLLSFSNYNSAFAQYLRTGDSTLLPVALTDSSNLLKALRGSDDYIRSVYIHTPRGEFIDNTLLKAADYAYETSALCKLLESGDFARDIYWGDPQPEELYRSNYTVIPMVLRFQSSQYNAPYYVVVNLDQHALYQSLADTGAGGNTFLYNADTHNILLAQNDLFVDTYLENLAEAEPGPAYQEFSDDSGSYYVFCESLDLVPWVLVTVKSQRDLFASLNATMRMAVLFTCGSVLVCVFASIILSNSITRSLRKLEQKMRYASENQDFDVQVEDHSTGEVGSLIRSFNSFVTVIRDLITRLEATIEELRLEREKVKQEQDRKRAAELRALQAQINPHFLYNTLNSIAWMAQTAGVPAIGQMTKSLGTFFEMSLSRGKEYILLREEIEQVKAYLYIQKIRYEEMLSYEIILPAALKEYPILKLVLQPLVENSIYHGIKEADKAGHVQIEIAEEGGNLLLYVRDDGVGMPEPLMRAVNGRLRERYLSEDSGYGIYNVNERIKMAYGDPYGLRYMAGERGGVTAVVTLPCLPAEEVG